MIQDSSYLHFNNSVGQFYKFTSEFAKLEHMNIGYMLSHLANDVKVFG